MISIDVPDRLHLTLSHLVLDYNGTLACDGLLIDGVAARLGALAGKLEVHVVTADTFGKARAQLKDLPVRVEVGSTERFKPGYVARLGPASVVAIGNGANDMEMLKLPALSIAVLGPEGAAPAALLQAKVVVRDIRDALDLVLHPKRLVATLRPW